MRVQGGGDSVFPRINHLTVKGVWMLKLDQELLPEGFFFFKILRFILILPTESKYFCRCSQNFAEILMQFLLMNIH